MSDLALLADARSSLERARSLSEVKAILDVAVAARKYAEAKKLGEDSLAYAQEIINRATRRMGEMLAADPDVHKGRSEDMSQRATLPKLGNQPDAVVPCAAVGEDPRAGV